MQPRATAMTEPGPVRRNHLRLAVLASILAVFVVSSAFWAYQFWHIRKVRPPVPLTQPIVLDKPVSVFDLPIEIGMPVLTAYLNGKTRGEFLKTTFWLQKERREEVSLTLTRLQSIELSANDRELVCSFPVDIEARLIDSRFGKTLARLLVRPVRAKVVITLATPVGITKNWHITTKFRVRDIVWEKEPVVRIGPFRKRLTEEINELLRTEKQGLTSLLDREIQKAADLGPTISDVWLDLQDPILIVRNPRPLWLRFVCNDISSHIAPARDKIVCNTRISATLGMLADTAGIRPPNPLPPFRSLKKKEWLGYSNINFYAVAPYREISEQLERHFKGKSIRQKGYHIVVRNIRAFGSNRGLSIAVRTGRDLKSDIFVSGRPVYDVPSGTIRIRNFDYAIETGDALVGTGDVVLHEMVRDSIARKLDFPVGRLVRQIPDLIHDAIGEAKAGKTIDLKIDSLSIRKGTILMGSENLFVLVDLKAKTSLRIKRIKAGKAIRIRKPR